MLMDDWLSFITDNKHYVAPRPQTSLNFNHPYPKNLWNEQVVCFTVPRNLYEKKI